MPKKFNSLAVQHHEQYINKVNKKYGSNYMHDKSKSAKGNLLQSEKLRKNLFNSLVIVFISLALSLMFSYALFKSNYFSSPIHVMFYLFTGAFTILAVTLWQIGNAESASGQLLHEKVHNWIFNAGYTVGTFFLGLGGGIDGFNSILP